jgi:hypothetical protein
MRLDLGAQLPERRVRMMALPTSAKGRRMLLVTHSVGGGALTMARARVEFSSLK